MNRLICRKLLRTSLKQLEFKNVNYLVKLTPVVQINSYYNSLTRKNFNIASYSNNKYEGIKPLAVNINNLNSNDNVGEEICGKLDKSLTIKILKKFFATDSIKKMALEVNISQQMFNEVATSFRHYLVKSNNLSPDLHILLHDLCNDKGDISDIFPHFYNHAKEMYPHLLCLDDLKKISDLREPANWFTSARSIERRIIYHAGPTNSGKTYAALKALQNAATGIYCGPLKLLATEVTDKINTIEKKCDLITGDDKRFVNDESNPSSHAACTIEMANLNKEYDVAVIDEIQMISDASRGWAWTRALLGLQAKEIHICGDPSAVDLVEEMCLINGDTFEVKTYNRLTPLKYLDKALENLKNIQPGDCIVCFNKKDLFSTVKDLSLLGHQVAVIYGSMPPSVKLAEAKRFNDPKDPCKILVATDAIGMGLNLNIKRVIFKSIKKPSSRDTQSDDTSEADSKKETNENGYIIKDFITTSQALQIAGRAGRYKTQFSTGEVTTMKQEDLNILNEIVRYKLNPLKKAGIHPTVDHIELFSFHLPKHSLTGLLDIFISLCQIDDSKYFLCNIEDIRYLAELIENIPLKLRDRYTFACAPINNRMTFVCSCFVKFVRQYSRDEPISTDDVVKMIDWPRKAPETEADLTELEAVFDTLDLYLWLSYRFPSMFPDTVQIKMMREELNSIIHKGIKKIITLNKRAKHEAMQTKAQSKIEKLTKAPLTPATEKQVKPTAIPSKKSISVQQVFNPKQVTQQDMLNVLSQNDENDDLGDVRKEISNDLLKLLSNNSIEIREKRVTVSNKKIISEISMPKEIPPNIKATDSSILANNRDNVKREAQNEALESSSSCSDEEEDDDIEVVEIKPIKSVNRNDKEYVADLEYLFVEILSKNMAKEKNIQRIIKDRNLKVKIKVPKSMREPE